MGLSLLGSIASGFMNAAAAIAVKVVMWTVVFDIFFSIFRLLLELVVLLVVIIYLISIVSLFFNIPYLLLNHPSGSLLPLSGNQLNQIESGNIGINSISHSLITNDTQLTTFNSIFGWSLFGGGIAFVFCLLVFILARAFVFTIGRFFNQRGKGQNDQQVKWAYQDGQNPAVLFFKGVLIVIVTILGLGVFYAVMSLVVLGLCVLFTLLGEILMQSIYENLWSAGGSVKTAIDSTFAEPAISSQTYHPFPTIFGNLINPVTPNASNDYAEPVILPIYLFYELFTYAGFSPSVTESSTTISGFNFGASIHIMGNQFITNIYKYDSWAGIGFIMLPWWLIILALTFFIASEMTKVFIRAIQRILVLVVYFLVIIIMAFFALADGGKQWWRFILSTIRWFLFNSIYMIMLNIACLLIFIFMLVGKIILDDTRSLLIGNNGHIVGGFEQNILGQAPSSNWGLSHLQWLWGVITSIATGFSYKLDLFSDLVMLIFLWLSVVGAKHIIFNKFNDGWFGKSDPAIDFFQKTKKELAATLVYAAAAGVAGFGLLKASSGIAHATLGRVGNAFRVKVAKWGDGLKRKISQRKGGGPKPTNLFAKNARGRNVKIGKKVGNEVILNRRGTRLNTKLGNLKDGTVRPQFLKDGKLIEGTVQQGKRWNLRALDDATSKAQVFSSRNYRQYRYNTNMAKKHSLDNAIVGKLSNGGAISQELRKKFSSAGADLSGLKNPNANFQEVFDYARNQANFNGVAFFDDLKKEVGQSVGDTAKYNLMKNWVANPEKVIDFPGYFTEYATKKQWASSKEGAIFDGFGTIPKIEGTDFENTTAGRLQKRFKELNTAKNDSLASGLKLSALGLGGAVAFSMLNSDENGTGGKAARYFRKYATPGTLFELFGLTSLASRFDKK